MFGKYPPPQQSTYFNQYGDDDGGYDEMDDEEGTIPLEEDIDSNYDPSEEEIIEYAEYLGMDARMDREYFYIAREGLKAPLPKPWRAMRNSKGEIFYVNQMTNEMTFVHPCDEFYKNEFSKAKSKAAQKKQNQINNNQQSRNKQDMYGNNNNYNFNIPSSKLNPPSQLGALKPKGILSISNNNSLLLSKQNMSQNSMLNSNTFVGSGSKNNSLLLQQSLANNNNQIKNEGLFKTDSLYQSKLQNNESAIQNKSVYLQGQQSSNSQPKQPANELFIFDEQSGNGIASNTKARANSTHKNADVSYQSFEDNDQQMKSSMNQSKLEFLMGESNNNDGKRGLMYTEQSDAMNDDQIEEELHFFENYLKKQYQNQVEEYEKVINSKKEEYNQQFQLDQIRQKNKKDEFQEENNKKKQNNQKKLSELKDRIKKEKYNELISKMEKQIKAIKQQHEENVENVNKKVKEDYEFEIEQYKEDKSNQYKFKVEDQKKKKQQREELIQKNKDKIEDTKRRLNQKFQQISIELELEQVQKLEKAENEINMEFQELQQSYVKELQEEQNRIYKLINRDEKDIQKEIFQKKIQLKDLYQRRYDVKKSEEMNKINDKLRQYQQEEYILLDERIKKEEQDFINNLIKQKLKEPQSKHQKEMEELEQLSQQKLQDLKYSYLSKMKNDEIQGLRRINEIRTDLEKENQKVLNSSFSSQFNNIDLQQQKVIEELQKSVNLKKQDYKLEKQQQKFIQQEQSKYILIQDLLESENRADYLAEKSGQKSELIDSYAKMLSYTSQKEQQGFQYSQSLFNSHSQYKSSNKKYDLPLQIHQHQRVDYPQQQQNSNLQSSKKQELKQSHQQNHQRDLSDDEEQPITTFLHQNLQQLALKGHQELQHKNQEQDNDQNNPPQSNRVVFPDDDSDDDFHDSFTQEQQRKQYINDSENMRNDIHKVPHDREDLNTDEDETYQNNMPLQRQDLSYRRSSNGQSHNQQILVENQQPYLNNNENSQEKQQLEDPLIQFLDEEWQQIDQLKEELRFDKIIIKKSYEYLQFEKNKMRSQIQLLESHSHSNQESQMKIKSMKNKLQQLSDAFNEDVKITRQNQNNLQNREETLYQIEDLLESGNFTQEQLSYQIDNYQKSIFQYIYPKLNQQIKQNQQGDQSKGNMSIEELLQKTFDLSQQYADFTSNFQLSSYQTQYKQQLDKQMHLYDLEKQFIKEDHNLHQQSRLPSKYQNFLYTDAEQLDQIFEEHTSWLKNMKQQLNQDLFTNRYQQISTRRKIVSPSFDNLNQKIQAANLLTKRIGNMTVLNI